VDKETADEVIEVNIRQPIKSTLKRPLFNTALTKLVPTVAEALKKVQHCPNNVTHEVEDNDK
jgi:hypothetical protein